MCFAQQIRTRGITAALPGTLAKIIGNPGGFFGEAAEKLIKM